MKVNGSSPVTPLYGVPQAPRQAEQSDADGQKGSDAVHLSEDARWIGELQAQARHQPAVREELVAEVQAKIAAGTLEGSVDIDAALDGLLADL